MSTASRSRPWARLPALVGALLFGVLAGWVARPAILPPEVDQATPRPSPPVTVTADPEPVETSKNGGPNPPAACLEALDITERLMDWIGRYEDAVVNGASDEEFQLLEEEISDLGYLWGMTEPVCREPLN